MSTESESETKSEYEFDYEPNEVVDVNEKDLSENKIIEINKCNKKLNVTFEDNIEFDDDISTSTISDEEAYNDSTIISEQDSDITYPTTDPNYVASNIMNSVDALRRWAIQFNVTHQALKGILSLIKQHYGDAQLPNDPRTLLKTSHNTKQLIKLIQGGQYWHQGLEVCLRNCFKNLAEDLTIQININIDGIPIHKSSKFQFWPILFNIYEMPNIPPMPIGIYIGTTKPLNITEYLSPFVDEYLNLVQNGCLVNDHIIQIKIRCFI